MRRSLPIVIALLAFGLRLAYVFAMSASPTFENPGMDALYNLEWAQAMRAGEDFLLERHHPLGEESAYYRAPGYVGFLSAALSLGKGSLFLPRVLQCVLGAITTLLVFGLGRRLFDARTGLLASAFAATYWVLIYFDAELLVPTLYVPLTLLGLWLASEGLEGQERRPAPWLLAAGLVFGLCAITRPNVLLFLPWLALWILLRLRGREGDRPGRKAIVACALFSVGVLLPVAPVTARNALVAGDFSLIATSGGVNFWIGNNPQSDGTSAIVPGTRAGFWTGYFDAVSQAEAREGRSLTPSEVSRHYARRTWEFVRSQPAAALRLWVHKLALFVNGFESANNKPVQFYAEHFVPWVRWLPLRYPELLALGLVGLVLSFQRGPRPVLLIAFFLVYSASIVAFFVCARFRVPILPPLMIFAAHAVFWSWDRVRAKRFGAVALAWAAVLAIDLGLSRRHNRVVPETHTMGWWHLGVAEALRGEHMAAELAMRKAVELDGRNVFARVALAKGLEATDRKPEALQHLREALKHSGPRVEVLEPLMRISIEEGFVAEAERLASAAIDRLPNLSVPYHYLGRVRALQGKTSEAIELYQRAGALDPAGHLHFLDLGRLAMDSGQEVLARTALERALTNLSRARPPEAEETFVRLIRLLEASQPGRARELARRYVRDFPTSARAQETLRSVVGD